MTPKRGHVPAVVRTAREAHGLTQKGLGEAVGFPTVSAERRIRHIELGTRPVPLTVVRKMAEVLGLRPEDLLP